MVFLPSPRSVIEQHTSLYRGIRQGGDRMLNLEQIRQLEEKVHLAVERIQSLQAENSELKEQINQGKQRIEELETEAKRRQTEQERIEAGVVNALSQLERLEEEVNSRNIQPEPPKSGTAQTAVPATDNKQNPEN